MLRLPAMRSMRSKLMFGASQVRETDGRCEALIRELRDAGMIPSPFDIDELIARLEKHRRRPVHLEVMDGGKGARFLPCGVLIQTVTSDHIMYVPGATPLHREHIIAHEIGHMLFEHGGGMSSTDLGMTLIPNMDPQLIKRMLGRASYSSTEEREAEKFASLLVNEERRRSSRTSDLRSPQMIAQVEEAWGDMRYLA